MNTKTCPFCKSTIPEESSFCQKCGKEVGVIFCPACGTKMPGEARFCLKCGKEIPAQPSPQTAPAAPMPPPRVAGPKTPVPAAPAGQQPGPQPRKKSRPGLVILGVLLVMVAVFIIFIDFDTLVPDDTPVTPEPTVTTRTIEEDNILWAGANTVLTEFVGDNLGVFATLGSTAITPEIIDRVTRQISDFDRALTELESPAPPAEQQIIHEALLPLYREIFDQMVVIRDVLEAGDPLKIDLEVQRLAMLLDELGGAGEILTLEAPPEVPETITQTNTLIPDTTGTVP